MPTTKYFHNHWNVAHSRNSWTSCNDFKRPNNFRTELLIQIEHESGKLEWIIKQILPENSYNSPLKTWNYSTTYISDVVSRILKYCGQNFMHATEKFWIQTFLLLHLLFLWLDEFFLLATLYGSPPETAKCNNRVPCLVLREFKPYLDGIT